MSFRSRLDRHGVWVFAVLALAPLVIFWGHFRQIFWFEDDWKLLDDMARNGFWPWILRPYNESFAPLFKLGWGALLFAGSGSYFVMILVLWLTHALNVGLLGRLLLREGFGWFATGLTLAVFGLSAENVESLCWSVVWGGELATLFFLMAALWGFVPGTATAPWTWRRHGVLMALIVASALSFSRGVLTGFVLGAATLLPETGVPWRLGRRLRTAAACILPGALVAVLIFIHSTGNQQKALNGQLPIAEAVRYGSWYFSLSPFYRFLPMDSFSWRTPLVLGILKLALIVWSLWRSIGRTRRLLALFFMLNVADSVVLGIGRYHTGLTTTVSSRYQYNALLCTLPFVGFWLESLLARFTGARSTLRRTVAASVIVAGAFWVGRNWGGYSNYFATFVGRDTRELLFRNPDPPPMGAIPGVPTMSTERAKELTQIYHLH